MDNLGAELKSAREFQGMSLEDMYHTTKISVKFLESIEEGDFSVLPRVYVRVFLKAYASAVGIQPEKVIKEYDTLTGNIEEEDVNPPEESNEIPEKFDNAVFIQAVDWFKENLKNVLTVAGGILIITVAVIVLCNREVVEQPPQEILEEPVFAGLNLTIEAQKSLYLMVSIDKGDSIDYYLLDNTKKDFLAQEDIWMLLSNAGAANVIVNGDTTGSLGVEGAPVHFTVDSTGLSILKLYPGLETQQ